MEHIIDTPCGRIKGIIDSKEDIISYKGIRYATSKRFEYPEIVTSWEGTYDAKEYGHCAYQARSFYDESLNPKKAFYFKEFRKGETYTYSEDCLFLNIWTPNNIKAGDNLPVIIYIHGGSFTGGCGHELHIKNPVWPKKGVIAITINYRLGPLGFACLKELKELDGHTGNYGLFDQLTAMKWVKNNIYSFGGDPNNITIMGQSAGSMSICKHTLSPLTEGLFQKAVMLSGGGVSKLMPDPTDSKQFYFWGKVMEEAGAKTVEEFKTVPVEKIYDAWFKLRKEIKGGLMACHPVIDGVLLEEKAAKCVKAKKYKKIPYIMGSTSEDVAAPFAHSMAKDWCKIQECDSYCFMFNHALPGDDNGAWHSSDIWYWLGTLERCWRPMTEIDYELSDKMTSYLTNFAKTANPNSTDLAEWHSTTKKTKNILHFGNGNVKEMKVNKKKLWHNLITNKAVGE